ncbi:hypothetical protein MBAV_000640 [Candidatus Magnetobacterium bavaricum]|uniref:Uncharacterized protein n=1 Tax=Candidatus Magnetobacterium bavaricum TaxID=29290 RepID=A0A0F3GZ33_9BACT|nr:hypothetical protein MBAV_000640 [Candidatus Magnetobacterium bavaricum]
MACSSCSISSSFFLDISRSVTSCPVNSIPTISLLFFNVLSRHSINSSLPSLAIIGKLPRV